MTPESGSAWRPTGPLDWMVIVWIATLGLTRVDLLGDAVEFLVTPFLVLSPILLGAGIFGATIRGKALRVPRNTGTFILPITALLGLILVSSFAGIESETSARRTLLLFLQVGFALLGAVFVANRARPRELLVRGAVAGLVVCVLFNALQISYWFAGEWLPGGLGAYISIAPGNYQGIVPRLTAASHDPNHGGMLVVGYIFMILVLGGPTRWRGLLVWLGLISVVLTLSRSVVLAGLVTAIVASFNSRVRWATRGMVLSFCGVIGGVAAMLLISPAATGFLEATWELLGSRLTVSEGSSIQHTSVMMRGWEVGTADLKQLLIGIGYGNAYLTLQDIFPGNPYGNFHSLFVTLFAESGIFAAAIGFLLFLLPLLRRNVYQPIIFGLFVFNIFQQSQTEPMFWLLLFLGYTGVGEAATAASSRRGRVRLPIPPGKSIATELQPQVG